jgi:hypothetical protein
MTFVLDPNAIEEASCTILGTFAVSLGVLQTAFVRAERPGATLDDLKQAVHLACTSDAVQTRVDQFEAIKQQPQGVGDIALAHDWDERISPANAPHLGESEQAWLCI